ncbi:MAG: helix-turn-helix domain-containing protein [Salinibacter sp.]
MKPRFENVSVPQNASWTLLDRRLSDGIPFEWHYHPEFELTLTLNSRGQRFVGDHIGDYEDGDLVLVGPNLPHTWESHEQVDPAAPHTAIVMWFSREWVSTLRQSFPELEPVVRFLRSAGRGFAFGADTTADVRPLARSLPERDVTERLPVLLSILVKIAGASNPEPLASVAPSGEVRHPDQERVQRVLDYIHAHYTEPIPVARLAEIAALSRSAFSRMFKRTTGVTVTEYIKRLRIGRACALLVKDRRLISEIAGAVGYNNLSNFNRQFRALKDVTPSTFRDTYWERHHPE